MNRWLSLSVLGLALAAPLGAADHSHPPAATTTPAFAGREFTSVNIEYKGSKIWVPGTFIVKKGENVRINLLNNAPSGVHGFAIDEYNVKVAVNNSEKDNKKVVEFTANQAGLFRVYCHMHPAHVGGQLLVLD
jgi:nitrosocyanin